MASARSKAMVSKTEDSMTEKTWTKNICRRQAEAGMHERQQRQDPAGWASGPWPSQHQTHSAGRGRSTLGGEGGIQGNDPEGSTVAQGREKVDGDEWYRPPGGYG